MKVGVTLDFITLDFETATGNGSSACAIGIGVFQDGLLADRYYRLIQPPENEYHGMNIRIHGIYPGMTENEPTFDQLWPDILKLIAGKLVLAHNAPFDVGVMRKTLDYYSLAYPQFNYSCTRQIAKKAWPDIKGHGLANMAHHLCIRFKHHNALEDAIACGMIALEAARLRGVKELDCLLEELNVKQKPFA